jgi:HPr kinase/phosphorylase
MKQRFRYVEKFVTIRLMRVHASCVARAGPDGYDAILLLGQAGVGKSDMSLRLIHAGWALVADDQVVIEQGFASAPAPLAGILEVRGLGLFRLPFLKSAALRLVVRLAAPTLRLPEPRRDEVLDLPVVTIDACAISAIEQLSLALEAACGRVSQIAGAFAM